MGTLRMWLFRVLVLAAGILMVVSWTMPWWKCYIYQLQASVSIRPWGLESNLGSATAWISGAEMPAWFAPFMWAYLGVCVLLLLFQLIAPERAVRFGRFNLPLPQALVLLVGVSYVVCVVVAAVFAAIRTHDFYGLSLIGRTWIEIPPEGTYAMSTVEPGYWLACAMGPILVVLALLRDRITARPKMV